MSMIAKRLLSAPILALGAVAVAHSADSGFYVGAELGMAQYPRNATLQFTEITLTGRVDDNQAFAWSLTSGYQFNRYVAVEARYFEFGESEFRLASDSQTLEAILGGTFSARGNGVSVVGTLPLGNWQPYIKAGVLFAATELSYTGTVGGRGVATSTRGKSEDLFGSVGLNYNFTERWQGKLDLTYVDAGESKSGHMRVLTPSVGFTFRF